MEQWLSQSGAALIALSGLYAIVLIAGERLPRGLARAVPDGLRSRLACALLLIAVLPVVGLTLVTSTGSVGWLLAAALTAACLAACLVRNISAPLRALESAVRQLDPETTQDPPVAPADSPSEVKSVFVQLAEMMGRVRESRDQLRRSLRQGERLRGELLQVLEARENEIGSRTEELRQATVALERWRRVDELTGVANRRWLAEFLENAWRAALREQHALSLLMVEVDYFKAYGDAAGIAKSDACIRAVAETISHVAARATDLVARHGGPRFVVVLANTPLEGALQVGEQIRTAVQALSIPRHRPAGVITVSVGVTSTVPTRGTRAETCLAAAERALRAAIERGHNQVGYSSAAHTGLFQSLCLPNDAPRPSS